MNQNYVKKIINYNFNKLEFNIKQFKSGRNNKVFKIIINKKKYVLKIFYNKKEPSFSRMKREIYFLKNAYKLKKNNVASLINYSYNKSYILTSYLQGRKILELSKIELFSISNFISHLNKNKFTYPYLAIDSCNSLKDHINLLNRKYRFFKNNAIFNRELRFFIENKFLPTKVEVINKIKKNINKKILYKKINKNNKIISPSDLSILNIKKYKNKILYYDFEYSGIDDPLKLICDIYCNPSNNMNNINLFTKKILNNFGLQEKKHYLLELFIPLHKLKWCLIILNEFIKDKREVRRFANHIDTKKSKIIKVNHYFDRAFL